MRPSTMSSTKQVCSFLARLVRTSSPRAVEVALQSLEMAGDVTGPRLIVVALLLWDLSPRCD